jgi:hypothetical protein
MLRKLLDFITVIVAVIILVAWVIDLGPVYNKTASILRDPNNYTHNNVK